MTEQITDNALDTFQRITLYDVRSFIVNYIDFVENHYPRIANYFTASSDISPTDSFKILSSLMIEQKKIIDVIILNASALGNYEYWALTEYIEDIGSSLETANNASKWLRSAITKTGYQQKIVTSFMAAQNKGLEDIEADNLKSNNQDEWVQTALQNQLREEDYTLGGGYLIKVIYKNNASLFLNSVVDNIDTSDKTYGLDIDQNIGFTNDDLNVLSYKDTVLQNMKILTDLKVGDDPAFRNRGLDVKNIIGGNLAGISYPIIFRQLAGNFATDDTFKSFTITDIRREQDAVFVDFQVQTKAGEVFDNLIQV